MVGECSDYFTFSDKHHTSEAQPEFLAERVDNFYQQRVKEQWQGRHILRGRAPGAGDIVLQSNDYLGIATSEKIVRAQVQSLLTHGQGAMSSDVFSLTHSTDTKNATPSLNQLFADFVGVEDALVTQSGWCANTGLVGAIAHEGVPVYVDMFAHMSLWEGAQSAKAKIVPFRHNNVESLERKLKKYGSGIILVDSVYSTLGDIAPLVELAKLKRQYDCILVVDESHSLGLYGDKGQGLVAALGLLEATDFITASLSKAFAGRGGLITCTTRMKEFLLAHSLPTIFSTSILPHDLAGFAATIEVIRDEHWRRLRLERNAKKLRDALHQLGYNLQGSQSAIISLCPGSEAKTIQLRDALEARGVFGSVYCPPATPKNSCLVRFSIHAMMAPAQLDRVIEVCGQVRDEVDMWHWRSTLRTEDKRVVHS